MGTKIMQNFHVDSVITERSVKNPPEKSHSQKKCESSWVLLFFCYYLAKVLANSSPRVVPPPITPVDPKSAQNPVNPEYLRAKKEQNSEVIELIYEYMLELVECEFTNKDPTDLIGPSNRRFF